MSLVGSEQAGDGDERREIPGLPGRREIAADAHGIRGTSPFHDDLGMAGAGAPPQNGIESALIDTAAEGFGDYLEWSEHLHMQMSTEVESERDRLKRDGGWTPPRLGTAEAIEQSSRIAERANVRFLRTLKALHDLRRLAPAVYVGNAGQVNVGTQQLNVSAAPLPTTGNQALNVAD